jgi:hypothetical protein
VATETDAARDRVIAARADLGEELENLEAAARAAVDIPAKIRRSPAKAAAVVGGVGFLALKGPQRLFGAGKRAVRGPSAPLPKSMLPKEIDKSLRSLGSDGDKVRGAIERDFAKYAKQAARDRTGTRNILLLSIARPLISTVAKRAAQWLVNPDQEGFAQRLSEIRGRAEQEREGRRSAAAEPEPGRDDDQPPAGV